MQVHTEAIVCAVLAHGEHGAIVRLLTPGSGLVAAYVRGGRGSRMRPVLIAGNLVSAQLRSRTESQLPQATIELQKSRAPILSEPLPSAAIDWVTALVATALPERAPYPSLYQALSGLLDALEAAQAASGWSGALARFEQVVLAELGYGSEVEPEGDTLAILKVTGDQLFRDLLVGRAHSLHDSRSRLIGRLRQALV